jgi:hypothetical protein
VPMCFAIDHANYARWLSVHIRDTNSLPESTKKEFQEHGHWVISKINNRNPKRERLRCLHLTPVAFRRWMLSGPELSRLQTQFEGEYLLDDDPEHSTNLQNHEQALSAQRNFQRQVDSLSNTIRKLGNPILDTFSELLTLDSHKCADTSVVIALHTLEDTARHSTRGCAERCLTRPSFLVIG